MKNQIRLLLMILLLTSCSGQNKIKTSSDSIIKFGSSGGFTNMTTEYVIMGNRHIIKRERNTETLLHTLDKKTFKEIYHQIDAIHFKDLKVNEPGNMTYFIEVKTKTFENKASWNDTTDEDQLKTLYKTLVSILKQKPQ